MFYRIFVSFLFILSSLPSYSQTDNGKFYVFTIGISDYSNTNGFGDLPNAVLDTDSLQSVLEIKYGAEIYGPLRNEKATRKNIFARFNQLSKDLTENDKLLVWFSGHGEYVPVKNKGYWITSNVSSSTELSEAVSYNDVSSLLSDIKAKHVMLIADACYSGALFSTVRNSRTSNFTLAQRMQKQSRYGLTSGGLTTVYDGERKGSHSPFAKALLELLNTNDQMYLSSEEIGSFLETVVPINSIKVKNKDSHEEYQIPQKGRLKGDYGGIFTVCNPKGDNGVSVEGHVEEKGVKEGFTVEKEFNHEEEVAFYTADFGGVYHRVATNIASISARYTFDIKESDGSVDNIDNLIRANDKLSYCFAQSDVFDEYKVANPILHSVLPLYLEEMHLITLKNSPIKTIEDIDQRQIGVAVPGSGMDFTLNRISKILSLEPVVIRGHIDLLFDYLRKGRIHAIFYVGGSPISKFNTFDESAGNFIELVPIKSDRLSMQYSETVIPKEAYEWLKKDVHTYGSLTLLVTNEDCETEECVSLGITQSIFDSYKDNLLSFGHPKWNEVSLDAIKQSRYTLPYIKRFLIH